MITSKQQAALNIAGQIDVLRQWTALSSPPLATAINQAIATELSNQAVGFAPAKLLRGNTSGFGDDTDSVDAEYQDIYGSNEQPIAIDTSQIPTVTSGPTPNFSLSDLGLDDISSLFSSAGSSAVPSLAATSAATSPASISGVLNSISNTVNSGINAVYTPQVTLAQAQAQLAIIQAQSKAAQLAPALAQSQQVQMMNLLTIGGIGVLAIFAIKAITGHGGSSHYYYDQRKSSKKSVS
jgi:hypothetical protein